MADKIYVGGITNTVLHMETDGTIIAEERQDTSGILDYTHAARNNRFDATSCDGFLRHEAEIPMTVYIEECKLRNVALFTKEADLVIESIMANPKYAKFRAAPTVRDPRIIMKGMR